MARSGAFEGGSGAGGGNVGSGVTQKTAAEVGRPSLLSDPASLFVSPVLKATTDIGAFAIRDTATVGAISLFYTGGEGLQYVLSGGTPAIERQLMFGAVRLLKGTKCVCRLMVYTIDNVPLVRFGLFNTNSGTALLSAVSDSIFHSKPAGNVTATVVHEWNNNGETSAASPINWYLGRFQDLSIEIAMDESVNGAGVVVWRLNGQVLLQKAFDASSASLTIPYDEDLFLTFIASGDGTVAIAAPVLAVTTRDFQNV